MNTQQQHIPVLMSEVLHFLQIKPGEVYVDATLGGGGHTRAILEQEPSCKVIGIDWDQKVIDTVGRELQELYPTRFFPVWGNFSKINELIKTAGFTKVQGVLADFGTSQIQIANTPGLSIFNDTPLDMRMSPAHSQTTAYDIVNFFSEKDLADIFYQYGEERHSRKIVKLIVEQRKLKRIATTGELAKLVEKVVFRKGSKIHPATKVFQALRIYVNKELENIHSFLKNVLLILDLDARLVCISFHSLEDRIVKQFFREQSKQSNQGPALFLLTKNVCMASQEEISRNRSSRSARLRAAIAKKYV